MRPSLNFFYVSKLNNYVCGSEFEFLGLKIYIFLQPVAILFSMYVRSLLGWYKLSNLHTLCILLNSGSCVEKFCYCEYFYANFCSSGAEKMLLSL